MMEWDTLVAGAFRYGFPAAMLGLELQICASPRMLDQGDAVSRPFQAIRSIIQGLRSGTRIARCVTNLVMERLTVMHSGLSEWLWIDDLSQSAVGSSRSLRRSLIEGVTSTHTLLSEVKLEMASKSTV